MKGTEPFFLMQDGLWAISTSWWIEHEHVSPTKRRFFSRLQTSLNETLDTFKYTLKDKKVNPTFD